MLTLAFFSSIAKFGFIDFVPLSTFYYQASQVVQW